MVTLQRFLGGYLRARLNGFSPERFLNLCMANQIVIWDLRYLDGGYQFLITVKDFRRVKPLVHKAQVRLKITGRYGLPFFLYRNRRRKLYAVGVTMFFLILFLMSRFIWNITVEGNLKFTDDAIIHYLDTKDIRYGMLKSRIDCDSLEESIRSDYPEIIWVSARVSGTRLLIRIKENEVMRVIPQKDESPRDLISDRDGTITRIVIRKGKAQVTPGDEVTTGQILVSGQIPIRNDAEEIVNYQYVRADADIYAQTRLQYKEEIPLVTRQRTETGIERSGLRLQVGPVSFLWMMPAAGENSWELTAETRQMVILNDFYLPIWIERIQAREYVLSERSWTQEELEQQKERINTQKIQNLMQKGVQIIENNVRILDKNSCWEIQGDLVLEELIGVGQNINQEEEIKQLDERNRDNH